MSKTVALPLALMLAGCSGSGTTGTADTAVDGCAVKMTSEGLAGALYSVFGTSPSDVYVVGADAGTGPELHHYNGSDWTPIDCGHSGDIWWGWHSGGDEVVFVGAGGAILSYAPSSGACTDQSVDVVDGTVLFGVWGSSADDIWAVGGNPTTGSGGVVFRREAGTWTAVADLPAQAGPGQIFKVWGSGADDVWFVGANALLLQWNGTEWIVHPPPIANTTTLFTVSGHAGEVYAVGGFGSGVVARYDGTTWTDDSPGPEARAAGFNGVTASDQGILAVGNSGSFFTRGDGWTAACEVPITFQDYHGSFIDADGGFWAVGGTLSQQTDGIIAYSGPNPPASISQ